MSAIKRTYGSPLTSPLKEGGGRSPPTSLIFLYALSLFFFKQRLLMWRIAQLAHDFTHDFTPDLNVSSSNPTRVTANFQFN